MLYFKFSTLCVNEKIKNHINKHSDNFINSCKQANMTFSFLFFLFFFFSPSLEVLLVLHLVKREKIST